MLIAGIAHIFVVVSCVKKKRNTVPNMVRMMWFFCINFHPTVVHMHLCNSTILRWGDVLGRKVLKSRSKRLDTLSW